MSARKLLKTVAGIPIYLTREIKVKGRIVAIRLVDAIDQNQKDLAVERVNAALMGNKILTEEDKKNVQEAEITSVPLLHES